LGILISVLFFLLFIRGMDIKQIWGAAKEANYLFVLLAVAINTFAFLVRAERWEYLLEPIKKIKLPSLFSAVCIGFMGNSLLPARAGEFIRAYMMGKREGISKSSALATIVIERLMDGLTILFMLIIVLFFFRFPKDRHGSYITLSFLKWIVTLTSFFYGIVIALLISLSWKPEKVWHLLKGILHRFLNHGLVTKTEKLYNSFILGLEALKKGRHMLSIIIYSIILWIITAFAIYILFLAFSIKLTFFNAVFLLVVVAVGVMLPSSPGYVGTFHLASSEALILLGIGVNYAKTFAIVHHAVSIVPVTLLGLFYLYRENMSFREIQTSAENEMNREQNYQD
jgi:uncharacterized protein (TIRG00374 family)